MKSVGLQFTSVAWGTISLLLLLLQSTIQPDTNVILLDMPYQSVGSAHPGWNVPISNWLSIDDVAKYPAWIGCLIQATVITWLIRSRNDCQSTILTALTVVLLSLTTTAANSIAIILTVFATRHAICSWSLSSERSLAHWIVSGAVICTVSALVTVDFGFVWLILTAGLCRRLAVAAQHRQQTNTERGSSLGARTIATTTVTIAVASTAAWLIQVTFPAFGRAMFRPLTAMAANPDLTVISHPFVTATGFGICMALLPILLVNEGYLRMLKSPIDGHPQQLASLIIGVTLGVTGVLSGYYFTLSVAAVLATMDTRFLFWKHANAHPKLVKFRIIPALTLILAGLATASVCLEELQVSSFSISDRLVQSNNWRINGNVLLTDLSTAREWKARTDTDGLQLLFDDRWDITGDNEKKFFEVVHDLRLGRKDRYRRSDGSFGGYVTALSQWNPTLIVFNSRDVAAIRRMTFDPDWKLVAIDTRWTVFASTVNRDSMRMVTQAADLFYFLEWPHHRNQFQLDGILELGTPHDSRVVSSVLVAIRLPYAALRVLPDDNREETQLIQAQSYTELAQRTKRQTGRSSLIDHYRAVLRFQELQHSGFRDSDEQKIISQYLTRLTESDISDQLSGVNDTSLSDPAIDLSIRQALMAGDRTKVRELLQELTGKPEQQFYAAIESLHSSGISTVISRLDAVKQDEELRADLRQEALFYLGCLSIEEGQTDNAIKYLSECRAASARSVYDGLVELFLRQLGAPAPVQA